MNFHFNDYLTKCDLIYKYNLENIKFIPRIKKINISLKINNDFKNVNNLTVSTNFLNVHLFLILYISYFCFPFVKYPKSKESKENFFTLNLNLFKSNHIFFLLDYLLVDNFYKLKPLNVLISGGFNKNSLLFKLKVPLNTFEEINDFLSFNNFNSKELYIILTFSLDNSTLLNFKSSNLFLRNLPYFWVFN